MSPQDIRKGFFDAVRKATSPVYVREEVLFETEDQGRVRFERKVLSIPVSMGETKDGRVFVRRRPL